MEFGKKLQELRKQKGLTQEELATSLYVSRTAISKWESGRGYPSIDSLKAIAKFFSITIDELLSSDEILKIAEADNKRKEKHILDLIYGFIDLSSILLLFLPFFAINIDGKILSVSLIGETTLQPYLKITFITIIALIIAMGITTLAMQNIQSIIWLKSKRVISLSLMTISVFVFIITKQPYPAVYVFVILILKSFLLIKWK